MEEVKITWVKMEGDCDPVADNPVSTRQCQVKAANGSV